jgi:tetratricopeptide (TPR) repeat protein
MKLADLTQEKPTANQLNSQAWELLTAKDEKLRDAKRALPLAREAVKLSEEDDGNILDTLALALHENGELAEAVRYAKMATQKYPGREEIAKRAKDYEEELAKSKK